RPITSISSLVSGCTGSRARGCCVPPSASRGASNHEGHENREEHEEGSLLAGLADRRYTADIQAIAAPLAHQRRAHRHPIADVLVERREHELQRVLAVAKRRVDVRRLTLQHACRLRASGQLPLASFALG